MSNQKQDRKAVVAFSLEDCYDNDDDQPDNPTPSRYTDDASNAAGNDLLRPASPGAIPRRPRHVKRPRVKKHEGPSIVSWTFLATNLIAVSVLIFSPSMFYPVAFPSPAERIDSPRTVTVDDNAQGGLVANVTLVPDPYAWMGNASRRADVDSYIATEQQYLQDVGKVFRSTARSVADEITRLQTLSDATVPDNAPRTQWAQSGWFYTVRPADGVYLRARTRAALAQHQGQDVQLVLDLKRALPLARRHGSGGPAVIDMPNWAPGGALPAVGVFEVSANGSLAAFSVDYTGSERFALYLWNVDRQELYCDGKPIAENTYYNTRWVGDDWVYYDVVDDIGVPAGIARNGVPTCPPDARDPPPAPETVPAVNESSPNYSTNKTAASPDVVYWETAEELTPSVSVTADGEFVVIQSTGVMKTKTLVSHRTTHTTNPFLQLHPLLDGVISTLEHHGSWFYVRTNWYGEFFEIVRVPSQVSAFVGATPGNTTIGTRALLNDTSLETQSPPLPPRVLFNNFTGAERAFAHEPGTFLEYMELFQHHLVVWVRVNGRRLMRWRELAATATSTGSLKSTWRYSPPWDAYNPTYTVTPSCAGDLESRVYRDFALTAITFTNSSVLSPPQLWQIDLLTGQVTRVVGSDFGASIPPELYKVERMWATADGRMVAQPPPEYFTDPGSPIGKQVYVPVDAFYRLSPSNHQYHHIGTRGRPTLVRAYGAYATMSDVGFDPAMVHLANEGLVIAWVHPRGDGDLGPLWHVRGAGIQKSNTFSDVAQAVHALIAAGWASQGSIALLSRSAGGLVAGAAVSQGLAARMPCAGAPGSPSGPPPEPWQQIWNDVTVVVAQVPFVDVVSDMADPHMPWTAYEWFEWGAPRNRSQLAAMRAYSPYETLLDLGQQNRSSSTVCDVATPNGSPIGPNGAPPAVYITAGYEDARVKFFEPVKYVAALRHAVTRLPPASVRVTAVRPIVLRVFPGGHFSGHDISDVAEWIAFMLTFIAT